MKLTAVIFALSAGTLFAGGGWDALPLGRVVPAGVFGERIAMTMTNNLAKVDYDGDFIRPFAEKTSKSRYVAIGKMTEALVLFAKQTGDPEMLRLKGRLVSALLDNQLEDGYIGCMRKESRLWDIWDAHEIAYIITALMCDWEEFGERRSLEGARRAADWVLANWKTRPNDWGRTWVNEPMYLIGQCQALLRLHQATKDRRYLDFCLNERALAGFDTPIYEGRDEMMWGHMYTFLNQCLAQHFLYRLQSDEGLFAQTDRAVDFLWRGNGATIAGHGGIAECWTDSQDGDGDVGETCATVYQMFLYDSCLRLGHGPAGEWGDRMERTVYNGLFAAQSPDGRRIRYYTPLLGRRKYFDGDIYCCPNNYRRAIGRLPQWLFYVRDDAVLANLYSDCEAKLRVGGVDVAVTERTRYPYDGRVEFTFAPERQTAFSFLVRIPKWCADPKVSLNGRALSLANAQDGLLRIVASWKRGDRVVCDFPMAPRCVLGRKRQSGRFAVMKGPLVYAYAPKDDDRHPFDIQATMQADPLSCAKEGDDVTMLVTTFEFAVGVNPNHKATQRICLVPFADPDATITYFRAPNLKGTVKSDDELFCRQDAAR